ncbi:MAG: class I SAM-dependent methyltransferase [Gammaproteobacteria bacterium]
MSTHEKETFLQTYDWVEGWRDLPWAHDEPTLFLAEICHRRTPGTALDIGCGAGTDSVYLAQQGWDVTSLDFMPRALDFTQQRAAAAGVDVTPVEADITTWDPPVTYDLVLDHGLLHNMDPVRYPAYRQRVVNAIADDGDFVLLHWHPLFPDQPHGQVGPRRVDREDIKAFFAPELQERFFAAEEFEDLPEIVGRGMRQAYYWFRHNPARRRPAEMIEQIEATLTAHGVDFAAAGDSDTGVDDELLATMLGPGRLGVAHRVPGAGGVAEAIEDFATAAERSPDDVENLLRVFASKRHGAVCGADARCAECGVTLCKRLRYR